MLEMFRITICFMCTTASQTEASVVLLVELLLSLSGGRLHQLFSPVHHAASLLLPLVPGDAPHVAEVPEVLDGVVFLQVGSDGLQAEDRQGI